MAASGQVKPTAMSAEDWARCWDQETRNIKFHVDGINPGLEKNAPSMINGRTNIKIFIPFCGKAVDIKWLADQGHTVVGVEFAQKAIEEFFQEHKVPFTTEPVPQIDGQLFRSEDNKIQLYRCDFFKFSKEVAGQMDGVWDRGGLVAINLPDREKYAAIIKSLMAPGCRYLLSAYQCDETIYGGPPHNLADESVQQLYGSDFNVKQLSDVDTLKAWMKVSWGIDWLREKVFQISTD